MQVPQSIDEIDVDWLGRVLRAAGVDAPLAAVECRPIGGQKGFLSSTVVAALRYAEVAPGAPPSVVVKIKPEDRDSRETERELGAFEREIRFYREVTARAGMRLPQIYYTAISPAGSVLVMEDLSHLEAGDQVHGLRHHQVMAAVRAVAALHASHWKSARLSELDWVPEYDHFWDRGLADHWPRFVREYELRIGREGVRLGERVVRSLDWLEARIAEAPPTLVHGDLRADNLLFDGARDAEVAIVIDWQLLTKSMAALDPTRLLGGSEPAAERRGHQLEVCAAWHEGLLRAGVRGYELEDALRDFRLGALYNLLVPVKVFDLIGDDPSPRSARLIDADALRLFSSAVELDAGTLLPV